MTTRTCREADARVTGGELDVEVRHERLHVVVAQTLEVKRRRELHVRQLHRVDVNLLHGGRINSSYEMLFIHNHIDNCIIFPSGHTTTTIMLIDF